LRTGNRIALLFTYSGKELREREIERVRGNAVAIYIYICERYESSLFALLLLLLLLLLSFCYYC
jgi:hypothetical protein